MIKEPQVDCACLPALYIIGQDSPRVGQTAFLDENLGDKRIKGAADVQTGCLGTALEV